MDRKSEPYHAEIECHIVGRRGGNIDEKGLVEAGGKVLVGTGDGGAVVGSMLGWLPREVVACDLRRCQDRGREHAGRHGQRLPGHGRPYSQNRPISSRKPGEPDFGRTAERGNRART